MRPITKALLDMAQRLAEQGVEGDIEVSLPKSGFDRLRFELASSHPDEIITGRLRISLFTMMHTTIRVTSSLVP